MLPGANVIKPLLSVIYVFSFESRAFVKLGYKSLIGTNTLAYYESLLIMDKKRFITLGPDRLVESGNTKGVSINVPLTSCLTGLELAV